MFAPRLPLARNTVTKFATTEGFFDAVLGPTGPDAHVRAHHQYQWLQRSTAQAKAASAAVKAHLAEMIAQARAEREALR